MTRPRPPRLPYPFIPPFDPPAEEPPYIPPETSGEDPGPRPPWLPEGWPWPLPPEVAPVDIEAPPPLPDIIWLRLPPNHPYYLPPGYHYPDNLPLGHPGHYYPGMPPYPVTLP